MTGASRIAIGIYLFINCLFLYKYGSRVTGLAGVACLAYVLGVVALLRYRHRLPERGYLPMLSLLWIGGITVAVHYLVPLTSLNVDRWSVIASFLDNLYAGEYPYAARSHMDNPPGPMPVYYLVAAPFYALNALEWLGAAGYLFVIWWAWHRRRLSSLVALLVVTSPFMYWEIAVRSNIFTFSTLSLLALQYFKARVNYSSAALVGALLATRSVYVLAYLPYYLAIWRSRGTTPFIGPAVLSALVFLATFLPFWLVWPEPFTRMNPFIVQGSFLLPPEVIGSFLLAATGLSFIRNHTRLALISGVLLFGVILLYFGYHLYHMGWEGAFMDSQIDISYFLFCVPFLGYAFLYPRPKETGRVAG